MKNLPSQGTWVRQAGVGFYRFWFRKNDPTTLGFMRIITGLVVLYVHFAYIFDLQVFFGPRGWWPQEIANLHRRENPTLVQPPYWGEFQNNVKLPDQVQRRVEVLKFFQMLPASRADREKSLRYLLEVAPQGESAEERQSFRACLDYAAKFDLPPLKDDPLEVEKQMLRVLDGIRDSGNIKVGPAVPKFLANLSEEQKQLAAATIVPFWHQLHAVESELHALYVLEWLRDQSPRERRRMNDKFLAVLPSDPEKRLEVLEYMANWTTDPNQVHDRGSYIFSMWFHLTDPTTMAAVHAVVMLTIVMFILGWYTRTTATLVWIFNVMYVHRINQILFGMDTMMNILLIYLMIGPSGAALSVDRLRARYRASKALLAANGGSVPWAERILAGPVASIGANFTIRLWQVHFCVIYLSAALSKLKGTTWWDLSAGWYTIANPEFSPIWMRFYEDALRELASHRFVMALFLGVSVLFTMTVELGFPFLIWTRLRAYALMGSAMLHGAIGIIMGLTCFSLFMMCLGLAYYPSQVIRRVIGILPGTGTKMKATFDPSSKRQRTQMSFLRAADIGNQIEISTGNTSALQLTGPDFELSGDGAVSRGLSTLRLTSGWFAKLALLPVVAVWSILLPKESTSIDSARPKNRSVA